MVKLGTGSDACGIDYTDSDGTNGLGWILVDASPATEAFLPILELAAFAKFRPSLSHVSQRKLYSAFLRARGEYTNLLGHVRERDVTARVNYYICAGSEHLLRFLAKIISF